MVQADVSVGEISCQQKFFHSFFFYLTLGMIIMAGNNATSEVSAVSMKNVSEMVAEASEASKDQQSEMRGCKG